MEYAGKGGKWAGKDLDKAGRGGVDAGKRWRGAILWGT
jgi:hypothetical protein